MSREQLSLYHGGTPGPLAPAEDVPVELDPFHKSRDELTWRQALAGGVSGVTLGTVIGWVGFETVFAVECGVVATLMGVGVYQAARRYFRKEPTPLESADSALAVGSLRVAVGRYEHIIEDNRQRESMREHSALYRAVALMRAGELDEALRALSFVLRAAKRTYKATADLAVSYIMMCFVARDEATKARIWLDAIEWSNDLRSGPAVLWAKLGDRDQVRALPTHPDAANGSANTAHDWRVVQLMHAFVAESDDPQIQPLLRDARPAYAGEYDYLAVRWPELRAFLDRHADQLPVTPRGHVVAALPPARVLTG